MSSWSLVDWSNAIAWSCGWIRPNLRASIIHSTHILKLFLKITLFSYRIANSEHYICHTNCSKHLHDWICLSIYTWPHMTNDQMRQFFISYLRPMAETIKNVSDPPAIVGDLCVISHLIVNLRPPCRPYLLPSRHFTTENTRIPPPSPLFRSVRLYRIIDLIVNFTCARLH
jgi:hypothetical protein